MEKKNLDEKMDYSSIDIAPSTSGGQPSRSMSSPDFAEQVIGSDQQTNNEMTDNSCFEMWKMFKDSLFLDSPKKSNPMTEMQEPIPEKNVASATREVPKKTTKKRIVKPQPVLSPHCPIALLSMDPPRSILKKFDAIRTSKPKVKTVRFMVQNTVLGKAQKKKK